MGLTRTLCIDRNIGRCCSRDSGLFPFTRLVCISRLDSQAQQRVRFVTKAPNLMACPFRHHLNGEVCLSAHSSALTLILSKRRVIRQSCDFEKVITVARTAPINPNPNTNSQNRFDEILDRLRDCEGLVEQELLSLIHI